MSRVEVLFLGNCQASRMAQFYGAFTPGPQKRSMLFRSITPHFGEYHEDETKQHLETADVAVVQLVTSDYVFNRDRVLDMRGGKSTVFIPYVYLPGFRVLEKLSSKGVPVIDGESVLRAEMDKRGEGARTALALTRGQVDGQNEIRFKSALSELQRREEMGADVSVADYIDATYIERMPCYSVNHPAPHILFHMYDQVAGHLGFAKSTDRKLSEYDIGRATLPAGTGGLSPYCVDALGLDYGPDTHWFSQTNRLAREVAKKWEAERS